MEAFAGLGIDSLMYIGKTLSDCVGLSEPRVMIILRTNLFGDPATFLSKMNIVRL